MKKHAGHGYHKTEIEHHSDGSHTVRHHVHPDHMHEMKDKSYAAADLDGVHDGLQEHMGTPNPGENEDAEGQALPGAGGPAAPAQQ